MSFVELFQHVDEWSVEELNRFMDTHHPDTFQLIDVRQPPEYRHQHLPGARLLPAESLSDSLDELDKNIPVILYCAHGIRSRAAGQVLLRAGFSQVTHLRGGLQAWNGGLATGLPAVTTELFNDLEQAESQAVLAWSIEENTRCFYLAISDQSDQTEVSNLFLDLAEAESRHQATLQAIWEGLSGRPAPQDFPQGMTGFNGGELLEGGMQLVDLLRWAKGRDSVELLEMAMALEINAYDHYLVLQRVMHDENSRRLFELLASEEKRHLHSLGQAVEKLIT